MSTTHSTRNKFSTKLSKNVASATDSSRIPKNVDNPKEADARNTSKNESTSDDYLTRMAIEEIVKETAKGAIRAEQVGPSGWLPCPLRKTNKRFLRNTIKSVISHNRQKTLKPKKTEDELDEIIKGGQRRKPKFGQRMHCFRRPNLDKDKEHATKTKMK